MIGETLKHRIKKRTGFLKLIVRPNSFAVPHLNMISQCYHVSNYCVVWVAIVNFPIKLIFLNLYLS